MSKNLVFSILLSSALLVPLFSATQSSAYVEARLHVGGLPTQPKDFNDGFGGDYQTKLILPFGSDLLWVEEQNPMMIGLRVENESSIAGNILKDKVELDLYRFAAILAKRFEREGIYWGPLVTLGFLHMPRVEVQPVGGGRTTYLPSYSQSFTAGVEAGWHLDVFTLGAEAGYQQMLMGDFKDRDGNYLLTSSGSHKVGNFSGVFARFQMGFRF